MILVLSRDKNEITTEHVMEWLEYFGADFFRLNAEDIEYPNGHALCPTPKKMRPSASYFNLLQIDDSFVSGKKHQLHLDRVSTVWYRRWLYFKQFYMNHIEHFYHTHSIQFDIASYLSKEMSAVNEGIFASLESANWLSTPTGSKRGKLQVLSLAASCGLDIPDSQVISRKKDLQNFQRLHGKIITKNLGGAPLTLRFPDVDLVAFTGPVGPELMRKLPEKFFPSLVQEMIEKEYELRIFFLAGKFYPMAIFSQNDPTTIHDFRNYNNRLPNRNVPYRLSRDLEEKFKKLIGLLELDTGSIDMIRARDGRWVFLEVNPVGQFGMVSAPCNYNLEKKVAQYLVKNEKKRRKVF